MHRREDRVRPASPFEVLGMDHAGPLYCEDYPEDKFYVLLVTCAVTRAVHLELVSSMSGVTTSRCFRRLAARRGLPRKVYSDNHKGFKRCKELVTSKFGSLAPKWNFIAPLSPWRGGWWERLVRSVKSSLKKTLGKKLLCREELETVLVEIEACLNSRPLTFVSDESDGAEPLTPAHFLLGHNRGYYSSASPEPDDCMSLEASLACRKCLVDQFWKIWKAEYVRNLPTCKGTFKPGMVRPGAIHPRVLKPGSLVLLQDNSPRLQWPLGLVEEVFPGNDGIIRTVQVRAKADSFVRSVEKLHMLELQRTETVANDDFSVNAEFLTKSRAKDSEKSKNSETKKHIKS